MNQTLKIESSPLTAAQMASLLAISPQAIRKYLRHIPATTQKATCGKSADAWHSGVLPLALRSRLVRARTAKGFNSVDEMVNAGQQAWTPAIALDDISDDCLADAHKLMRALLPSLERRWVISQGDFEREGVADYEKVFGLRITTRHFRNLIGRTVERDGGRQQFDRVELYLPAKPARKSAPVAPAPSYPFILQALEMSGPMETLKGNRFVELSQAETIWRAVFRTRQNLLEAGLPASRADRRLRDYISRIVWPSVSRKALQSAYTRKLAKTIRGEAYDRRTENGAEDSDFTRQINALPWFRAAARFFYLDTNRTADSGSMPEAIRLLIELPKLPIGWPESKRKQFLKKLELPAVPTFPPELREIIQRNEREGKALVPRSVARLVTVNKAVVRTHRNPREASLDYLSAPGSQRRHTNADGERVLMQPGDWIGGDDSTPGIAVCVPCEGIQTPASEKFSVLLGRFQWLPFIDARSDKILSWSHVVRPRGSYRAEDVLSGIGAAVKVHGIPRRGFQFEGGTWNSKLVRHAIEALGCEHWRTYSPHQKAIESIFNRIWTKLAVQFPHADMGRYRNENEANCHLYEACKAGHKNPRQYFPTLAMVLAVFDEEVRKHNAKTINSDDYGRWQPDEFFDRALVENPLVKCGDEKDWIFAPFVAERKVRGMGFKCSVPMFENFSVPFAFGADWLPLYDGKLVRIHFNPHLPKCVAKVVLLERATAADGQVQEPGTVLGNAQLISETAQLFRYLLDWGADNQQAGFKERQKAAQYLRRETRGIGSAGRVEYSRSEERDGLGAMGIIERNKPQPAPENSRETSSSNRLAENLRIPTREERRAEVARLEQETAHLFE